MPSVVRVGQHRMQASSYATAPAVVSVGTAAVKVLSSAPERVEARVQAPATTDVYWGSDSTVTVANGIRIPAGSVWIEERYLGEIWCIVAAGTVNVPVQEVKG